MNVYFDNAATTPMDPEVIDVMHDVMKNVYGNPSSTHEAGRAAKVLIEKARKSIAETLHCSPGELIFTSGGTEANNIALQCSSCDLGVDRIISSPVEHHAVLHTVEHLIESDEVSVDFVKLTESGQVDMEHLEQLLQKGGECLVSLMHVNNETGNLLDLHKVAELCEKYGAYFHADTVQGVGHYPYDLQKLKIHFLTCAAHKFHGPKGVGFLYVNKDIKMKPLLHGGSQERGMRAGTENSYGIAGMEKAIEVAYRDLDKDKAYIEGIKSYMIEQLKKHIPHVAFNGTCTQLDKSVYTVLNVRFPESKAGAMLLFQLDMAGIAISSGSACSSGSDLGSHVLKAMLREEQLDDPSIRFSFSKYNTREEVDYAVSKLKELV